eukprot:COSAG01_NODE_21322_length_907_cov_1.426980_2_plen_44_part_01
MGSALEDTAMLMAEMKYTWQTTDASIDQAGQLAMVRKTVVACFQ